MMSNPIMAFEASDSQTSLTQQKKKSVKNTSEKASLSQTSKKMATQQTTRPQQTNSSESTVSQLQYNTEPFGGFRSECVNQDFLYKVCSVANDLLDSATILVQQSGMTIQTTDSQSVAVILVDMPAKMFSSYRCEGFVTAHVCMDTLVNMIKKIGSDHARCKLTLEIRPDDTERMLVTIYDSKKRTTTTHIVKLWEPKNTFITFDDGKFNNYRVVSSRAFHEEINNLSHLVDQGNTIRIIAGNDLKLSIEDEYGESTTIFQQNKSPGYNVVQKSIDINAKDKDGNYVCFNEIEGLLPVAESSGDAKKRKLTKPKVTKKTKKQPQRRGRNVEEEEGEDEEMDEKNQTDNIEAANQEADDENADSEDYLSAAQLAKFAKPLIDDEDQDNETVEPEKIEEVRLPVLLLLLKMISKGLRLHPELYLFIKKNSPIMFVQRIDTYGRFLIALAPNKLEEDEQNPLEENAMDSLMAIEDEEE